VRVLTLNVQHDAGDPRRTALVNRLLRGLALDVAVLQEVCLPGRSAQLDALLVGTGLARATHQVDVLGEPPAALARFGGTAVATREPHEVVEVREHRPVDAADAHGWVLAVRVRGVLVVVPTTPWEPAAEPVRERLADEVVGIAERHGRGLAVVVAGDLNAGPDAPSLRRLTGSGFRDAWAVAGDGPGHTWTVDNPLAAAEIARLLGRDDHRARIDHVLVAGPARVTAARLVADRPVDGVWLGDHAGVLVEVDLPGG
jgi:endonuclease/exonuclease/phosphatase family metal-dependent hydrolase